MAVNPVSADYLVDRSRLRRKLSFWRVVAILAVLLALGAAGYRLAGGRNSISGDHIARVTLSGVITGDRATIDLLERVGNSNAKAVLLNISSPGGTTTGAEAIYEDIRRLAAKKPVVAVVQGMAASGAYIAALGADRIVAQQNSLVGSIGVLVQIPNFAKLMEQVGVNVETIKSTPLKASPNTFEPVTPEAREAMSSIVLDSYDWFRNLVRERRKLDDKELAAVANGRVFTGRQSIGLKLVDELGNERTAIAWLEKEKNVPKDLRVREWRRSTGGTFGLTSAAWLASALGFESVSRNLATMQTAAEVRMLDGLVAVWHGALGE
jgi:protease-4